MAMNVGMLTPVGFSTGYAKTTGKQERHGQSLAVSVGAHKAHRHEGAELCQIVRTSAGCKRLNWLYLPRAVCEEVTSRLMENGAVCS